MSAACGALQPAQPCPLMNLGSRQPDAEPARQTRPQPEQLPCLPERVKDSYRSPAALAQSRGCWETGSRRAAHIQQHHAGIFPLRTTASSSSSLPSLSSLSLPPFLSSPFFLKIRSCALELCTGHLDLTHLMPPVSLCSPVLQLKKFFFLICQRFTVIHLYSTHFFRVICVHEKFKYKNS